MATTPSSRTPSDALPENAQTLNARRTSLGFLRRSKSTEPLGERKVSGRKKMSKTEKMEDDLRRQRESYAPRNAPRLPDLSPAPQLETFGGEERGNIPEVPAVPRPKSSFAAPQPVASPVADIIDPYARNESMTHRGRYSYASSAVSTVNSPRRVRRRKDPTPYNVLVVGARNSGKTSFLNFLRQSLTMPAHKHPSRTPEELEELESQTSTYEGFTSQYLETEIDGERVGLTLWDSNGLERNVVDIQMRGVTGFLESKFEETLAEEMKVVRSPGARDTHIHCTFLLLDPVHLDENIAAAERAANGTPKATDSPVVGVLDQNLDLQVLRTILGKTTIVPVISKADTITAAHMGYPPQGGLGQLEESQHRPAGDLDPGGPGRVHVLRKRRRRGTEATESAEATNETKEVQEDKEIDTGEDKQTIPPLEVQWIWTCQPTRAILNPFPDPHSLASGEEPVGRRFPWGFADPYNAEHCDFVRLKESVFTEWRSELREASRVVWYERWRTNRLNRNGQPAPLPSKQYKQYGGRMGPIRDGRRTR
ncbi:hypothetical protein N7526_010558 [Penicillium atrosanguineum]|nr:hypothetical protein N7526_010558 [Penicillium atrosanguineum]